MRPRPALYVLAGVNGAGKSSIGGHDLRARGLNWFNPDTFAREVIAEIGGTQEDANGRAWAEGLRRLDEAIAGRRDYAFETTLGGRTIPARIKAATSTHDVIVWFCGLSSPELHIARVKARVAGGGHDIPEAKIRERYVSAIAKVIALMPSLAGLSVYDNSRSVAAGEIIPDPDLVLTMAGGRMNWPSPGNIKALSATPDWAKPIVEAAIALTR